MKITFFLIISVLSLNAFSGFKNFHYEKNLIPYSPLNFTASESRFDQYIDHYDKDLGTFKQRYFVETKYAVSALSPVILYLCGESRCNASSLKYQIENRAREWGAILIALEHRYYGDSQPFDSLSNENLRFLSIDQALKDTDNFQKAVRRKFGLAGKWIVVGGSYPGSLAAYYRTLYPDNVVGALASSGPVMAKENYEEYDAHVVKVAGDICTEKMREVVSYIEERIDNEDEFNEIKEMFKAQDVKDSVDFLYLVADVAAAAIQYGYKDEFCSKLINSEDALDAYAKFALRLFLAWGAKPVEWTFQIAEDTSIEGHNSGVGMRQWLYQSCTEYGYWQVANSDPELSHRSSLIDLNYHRDTCKKLFGLRKPADTERTNNLYFFPILEETTSNILFTNGSEDPWSILSITPEMANINPNITSYTIQGEAHCNDLYPTTSNDSEALTYSRLLFKDLAREWLRWSPNPQ